MTYEKGGSISQTGNQGLGNPHRRTASDDMGRATSGNVPKPIPHPVSEQRPIKEVLDPLGGKPLIRSNLLIRRLGVHSKNPLKVTRSCMTEFGKDPSIILRLRQRLVEKSLGDLLPCYSSLVIDLHGIFSSGSSEPDAPRRLGKKDSFTVSSALGRLAPLRYDSVQERSTQGGGMFAKGIELRLSTMSFP
ncbi:hypothetical protein ACFE04_011452 [Oxalis oulophora]